MAVQFYYKYLYLYFNADWDWHKSLQRKLSRLLQDRRLVAMQDQVRSQLEQKGNFLYQKYVQKKKIQLEFN